jgi:hypothetical protein
MCGVNLDPIDLFMYIAMFSIGMVSAFCIDAASRR